MMTTMAELIEKADGGGDPSDTARQVLKALAGLSPGEQQALLLPLVRAVVVRMRRHEVRKAEDTAFRATSSAISAAAEAASQAPGPALDGSEMEALRKLADKPFLDVETDLWTKWGEATARQHRARARWLRANKIKPTMETAMRHEAAAGLIEAARVRRLSEVPGYSDRAA